MTAKWVLPAWEGPQSPQSPVRLDGSVHADTACYLCGVSNLTVPMDPVIFYNPGTAHAEYRWACADLGECVARKNALTGVTP